MHDLPRQKLSELVAEYGHGLCDDAKRLEGMLKDVLRNEHKREMFVLVSALREGVAAEFRNSVSGMPLSAVAAKLVRQLRDNLALDETAARWAVESWAFVLGVRISQSAEVVETSASRRLDNSETVSVAAKTVQQRHCSLSGSYSQPEVLVTIAGYWPGCHPQSTPWGVVCRSEYSSHSCGSQLMENLIYG